MQVMAAPDPTADSASVPLALVEQLLVSVAGLLHDRPVQSMVAGRLMIETALPSELSDSLLARGVRAVTTAAEQSRDVMWALTPPGVRGNALRADVHAAVGRGTHDAPLEVVVAVDPDVDHGLVTTLVRALHLVAVEVLFAGGAVTAVRVDSDAEGLQAEMSATTGRLDSPWLALAAHALKGTDGGPPATIQATVQPAEDGGGLTVELRIPVRNDTLT